VTIQRGTRQSIEAGAEQLRALAQRAGRGWQRVDDGDEVRIEGDDLQITLRGGWRTGAADYLEALNPYAGSALAELLWLLSLPVDSKRTGDQDRAVHQAASLVTEMRRGVSRPT
jgi:hypothetical protein